MTNNTRTGFDSSADGPGQKRPASQQTGITDTKQPEPGNESRRKADPSEDAFAPDEEEE